MKKGLLVIIVVMFFSVFTVLAQETTEPDPAIAQAKEDTLVVYDLGRFFGYVLTMERENPKLTLGNSQLQAFYEIMADIVSMKRIEPEWADEKLTYLELDVLSAEQLMAVDELAIAREESRDTVTATSELQQKGGGTGAGALQTYVAGGAFNPIIDETKSIGQGFAELYAYVTKKLGK